MANPCSKQVVKLYRPLAMFLKGRILTPKPKNDQIIPFSMKGLNEALKLLLGRKCRSGEKSGGNFLRLIKWRRSFLRAQWAKSEKKVQCNNFVVGQIQRAPKNLHWIIGFLSIFPKKSSFWISQNPWSKFWKLKKSAHLSAQP